MRNDTYLRIICPLFSRRPHIVSFDMNDICCCYKTESLESTPEALERWDRVKIPRCAVHLQMLSTECNLASSRARRLSAVLVFKIVLTSSKTSSAGHKFCSPENITFIVVSLFLVSNTVQTSRKSSQFWFLSPENIIFIVLSLVLVSKLVARGLLQDSILVSSAQKMANRAEVTFKTRLNKIVGTTNRRHVAELSICNSTGKKRQGWW